MTPLLLVGAALAQDHRFPTTDAHVQHFYPTAYKDHDGVDWSCGSVRYGGHRGSDFGVGGFAGMDAGRDLVASAPGVVIATHDGEYDRCTSGECPGGGGFGNHVIIRHADGKDSVYAHMRQWTVGVSEGEVLRCGDALGQVGSSGYSTGPHVHFAIRYVDDSYHDPFDGPCSSPPSYWVDQGDYRALPTLDCGAPAPCAPAARLACGDTVTARNDGGGSADTLNFHGCSTHRHTGPERVFELATDRDEPVSIGLEGLSSDLDVTVHEGLACDATACLAGSFNGSAEAEALTFDARAGVVYAVVVDGFNDATSDFTLTVACAGSWPDDEPPDSPVDSPVDSPADSRDDGSDDSRPSGAGDPPGGKSLVSGLGCASAPGAGGSALALALLLVRRRSRGPGRSPLP